MKNKPINSIKTIVYPHPPPSPPEKSGKQKAKKVVWQKGKKANHFDFRQ